MHTIPSSSYNNTTSLTNSSKSDHSGLEQECSICLTNIIPIDHLQLSCKHSFHTNCITNSLLKSPDGMRCPNCRTHLNTEIDPAKPEATYYKLLRLLQPLNPKWLNSLAFRTTNTLEKFALMQKAVELEPSEPKYWKNLASFWSPSSPTIIIFPLSQEVKAITRLEAYKEALRLNPKDKEAALWISHLQSIQSPKARIEMDIIQFYRVNEIYGEFSNFASFPIEIGGKTWPTSEHYFQAEKFTDSDDKEFIRLDPNPMKAAHVGRNNEDYERVSDWHSIKDQVMLKALNAKFTQHPKLLTLLLDTASAELIEHTTNDCYWADGGDGSGENKLGKLLMHIREEASEMRNTLFPKSYNATAKENTHNSSKSIGNENLSDTINNTSKKDDTRLSTEIMLQTLFVVKALQNKKDSYSLWEKQLHHNAARLYENFSESDKKTLKQISKSNTFKDTNTPEKYDTKLIDRILNNDTLDSKIKPKLASLLRNENTVPILETNFLIEKIHTLDYKSKPI